MKKTPLPELVEQCSQKFAADGLGVSVAAIAKALKAKRDISVIEHANGSLTAIEVRVFPHKASAQSSVDIGVDSNRSLQETTR